MIDRQPGDWLTAARVARLPVVLRTVRAHPPPGVSADRGVPSIWKVCGGPLDDVPDLLETLIGAGLIVAREGHLRISQAGRLIATQDHQRGGTLLAHALIRAGYFADQARRLGELGQLDPQSGDFRCRRAVAVSTAPQLVGILRTFPTVSFTDWLVLPASLAAELADVWTLPAAEAVADPRNAVGWRGELYSYRFEQANAADPGQVHWVAQDDDALGYDIEDLNYQPRRRIEVKASTGAVPRFILSLNEWVVAHRDPATYEIQFWGGIDLAQAPRNEYARLRRSHFPIIYRNLPVLLAAGQLIATPAQYLVTARP